MNRPYSIFVLKGTQMRRFVISPRGLRCLLLGGMTVLAWAGWFFGDYHALQRKQVQEAVAKARAQEEKLVALRERTTEVQEALSQWQGFREKIQASVPPRHKNSAHVQREGEELQKILADLESDLKQMIAALPSDWPVQGRVVSGVGMRLSPWTGEAGFHSGLDIPNPIGTPVRAPGDAVVESIEQSEAKGRTILLNHGQQIKTQYAHLSKVLVNKGDHVRKGQPIAEVGNTGKSTGPHLHYEVRVNGIPVDPRQSLLSVSPEE
ncbi:MAG TPA: M23 family metallopeptidase [Candidatus Binatia bacterium]|nr:M23 family metallopeptidase [Candidatus Binatia bacterium]